MVHLQVWCLSEFTGWSKFYTDDYVETKDEEKYFRVIRDGNKEFYYNSLDYLVHINAIEGLNPKDFIKDQYGKLIVYEPTVMTDVDGRILNKNLK